MRRNVEKEVGSKGMKEGKEPLQCGLPCLSLALSPLSFSLACHLVRGTTTPKLNGEVPRPSVISGLGPLLVKPSDQTQKYSRDIPSFAYLASPEPDEVAYHGPGSV